MQFHLNIVLVFFIKGCVQRISLIEIVYNDISALRYLKVKRTIVSILKLFTQHIWTSLCTVWSKFILLSQVHTVAQIKQRQVTSFHTLELAANKIMDNYKTKYITVLYFNKFNRNHCISTQIRTFSEHCQLWL